MNKLLWVEKFGSILGFLIFGSLAFIAHSEENISYGSPKSALVNHEVGINAVITGILFLAGSGYLFKHTVFYRYY